MLDLPKVELSDNLYDDIIEEMCRAQSQHGPLTTNYDRVFLLLGEEYGEVAKEIAELNRLNRQRDGEIVQSYVGSTRVINVLSDKIRDKRKLLKAECVQMVALLVHFINNLDKEIAK